MVQIDFENDPIHLKPQLDNFADVNEDDESNNADDSDDNADDQNNKTNRIYRPPKMAAVYNGN